MVFDFRKGWKFWVFLGILIVAILILVILRLPKVDIIHPSSNESENKPWVDPLLGKEFEEKEWARVRVYPTSTDLIDSIISSIPKDEFILGSISPGGEAFNGDITKEGLEVLVRNSNVKEIWMGQQLVQPHLYESVPLIGVRNAVWNLGITGKNKTICVIDSGINKSHPSLTGKVLYEVCYCDNPYPLQDCCPNNQSTQSGEGAARDNYGHGTHVAGIITSYDPLYRGVAYDSELIAIKVLDTYGSLGDDTDILNGISWCTQNKEKYNISVISISLGYFKDNCSFGKIEIENATSNGISVVVSAGNEANLTNITWPSCVNKAIPVGAVYDANIGSQTWCLEWAENGSCIKNCTDISTNEDKIACFSNRGIRLNLLAPGSEINSTDFNSTGFKVDSGTSMAAPHVSGSIALLLQLKPDLTPDQIKDVLNITGKPIFDINSSKTYSRIDVYKAIMAVNASLLQIHNLTEVNFSENERIFRFRIMNANLSNITNISWEANMGTEEGTVKSNENIASLLFGESAIVLFRYTYTNPGQNTVTVHVRAGNLNYSATISVDIPAGNLEVMQLGDVSPFDAGLEKIIRFKVRNFGEASLSNINWTFDYGDNTNISAISLFNLSASEEMIILLRHVYSNPGNYVVNASAFSSGYEYVDSITKTISVPSTSIEVSGLAVVNVSSTKRIFKFIINNPLSSNLSIVNWTLDFGDNQPERNSTENIALVSGEDIYVLAEHTYTSSGPFQVNATARADQYIDSQNISINVA